MKKRRIFLLVDWIDTGDFFLQKELQQAGWAVRLIDIPNYSMKDRTVKFRIILLYFKYMVQVIKAIRWSAKDDIIVCWNFTTGMGAGLINRLFLRKRRILALNMISHFSSGMVSKIRFFIFRLAMNQSDFHITVNAANYIAINAKRFKVPERKFFVLPDPVKDRFPFKVNIKNDGYVFSGGEAQRDWRLLFEAARQLPDIAFKVVARKKYVDPALIVPANVHLLFDVEYDHFSRLMASAALVVIPLTSTFPCGLIVIGDAGLMKKAVIVTRTPSTENYILPNETGILIEVNDLEAMKNEIRRLFDNSDECQRLGENLHNFLRREFAVQNYIDRMISILEVYT